MITVALALTFIQLPAGTELTTALERATADAEALTSTYEAGGAVYACNGTYVYSAPQTQNKRDAVAIEVATFTDTCTLAALYHTHPKGDARFSRADIDTACRNAVPSYILPHGGRLRVFDCMQLHEQARATAWEHPVLSRGKEI